MASPSVSDQGKQSPASNGDIESSQDSTVDVKVKDEPADSGYELTAPNENHSSSNSRTSSPPSSVNRETVSPFQDPDNPSSPRSDGQQIPLNDIYTGSSIRSQLHGTNTGKKVDTVQNIVEGLLKKNATLLAMSDAGGLKPNSRRNKGLENVKRGEASHSAVGQSTIFPISTVSQARLVSNQANPERKAEASKTRLLRPKSPTRKCESILRDDTQLSYALMEANVGDPEAENIFRVQHHELVCAVSLKSFVTDREKNVVAVLDNSYFWCNFCSFSSTNKELLTQHIMDHRFGCNHCPYESFCRSDIIRHMAVSHSEFSSSADALTYCTFLSDYLRVKSRFERIGKKLPCTDPDDDVDDLDKDEMQAALVRAEKRRKEDYGERHLHPEKRARFEDDARVTESSDSVSSERPGKSRKNLKPRRHPQPSENDFDTFEMEVEEINDYVENGNEMGSDRGKILYPSQTAEDNIGQTRPTPPTQMSRMQVIPSLQDGGRQGFTTTHIPNSSPAQPGRPAKTPCPFNKTKRTSGSSSLYWSCGYCDFQSNSQAEIKEHSNRSHPGNPHRYEKSTYKPRKTSLDQDSDSCHNDVNKDEEASTGSGRNLVDVCLKAHSTVKLKSICRERMDQDGSSTADVSGCRCGSDCRCSKFHKGLCGLQTNHNVAVDSKCDNGRENSTKQVKERGRFKDHGLKLNTNGAMVSVKSKSGTGNSTENGGHLGSDNDTDTTDRVVNSVKIGISISNNDNLFVCDKTLREEEAKDGESLTSPPLKLTFKTIGQITTCRIKDENDSRKNEIIFESESGSSESTHSTSKVEAKWENDLMDSSGESDFDISSNPRSAALSVSSISEIFDNSLNSPSKEMDIESQDRDDNQAASDVKHERSQCGPVCNEKIICLSSPCYKSTSSTKMGLSCVPARSAAVKAMTKMKPGLETEVKALGAIAQTGSLDDKKQPVRYSQSQLKSFQPNPGESHSQSPPKVLIKSFYSCCHCADMKVVTLSKIRSHLLSQHLHLAPIVTNVRHLRNGKNKRKLYLCLYPSCTKLVKSAIDLDHHKSYDHNTSLPAKPKERKTMNSLSTSSVSSITQVLTSPASEPLAEETFSDCCVKLHHLNRAQISRYCGAPGEKRQICKYECLYCTEIFSCNTLSDIKQHYLLEHPCQLFVMRDVEAKRAQLPSRIYACDDTGCDFTSACRNDILAHSSCHNTNCTSVYECPSCGWYSSSYRVAEDHVKDVHADEQNISLIRMQLSVDDNGHTSKKILR